MRRKSFSNFVDGRNISPLSDCIFNYLFGNFRMWSNLSQMVCQVTLIMSSTTSLRVPSSSVTLCMSEDEKLARKQSGKYVSCGLHLSKCFIVQVSFIVFLEKKISFI